MEADALLDLCDRGVTRAIARGADEAEVASAHAIGSSVDFEKNDLQIAISDEESTFGVRVIKNGAVGFATSNDPTTLEETIEDALAIAVTSVPDPYNRLPDPRPVSPVAGLHDAALAALDVAHVTRIGDRFLRRVREIDPRVSIDSGSVSSIALTRAIRSSRGVAGSERSTTAGGSLFGMAVDGDSVGSFIVEGHSRHGRAGLEEALEQCSRRFVEKALGALNPTKGESFRGAVLFTPEAASSLIVSTLIGMMSSPALRKGKTPLVGRVGESLGSPLLSILDDATVAGAIGSTAFDREGIPPTPLALLDRGVFSAIPYNHYEALAAGRTEGSSGHAGGGASSLPTVGPKRIEVAAGTVSLSRILEGVERAVVVTRFSGNTNPVTGEFSGVVKGGFLAKGGERRPIAETLIAGKLLDVLANVRAVSEERELLYGRSPIPWILADGISVTSA